MRVLKMDFLRTPAVGDLVEHHLGDLHLRAANPGDAAVIELDLRGEDGSHWFSPGTSILCRGFPHPSTIQHHPYGVTTLHSKWEGLCPSMKMCGRAPRY